jgi:uncharacterized protein YkwD
MVVRPTRFLSALSLILLVGSVIFALPGAPINLVVQVSGSTVTLSWSAPAGALTGFRLEAGSAPGLSDAAVVQLDNVLQFTATDVPSGTYYVRVRAIDAEGAGPPSNEVVVQVGALGTAPSPPTNLVAQVTGSTVTITWSAPPGTVTGYRLEAGSASGLSNIADMPLGPVPLLSVSSVPPGTYHVRVRAFNAAGLGAPSQEIVLVVSGGPTCEVPAAPVNLTVSVNGSAVTLSWQAVSGAGITYVLEVGSGPGLSNIGPFPVGATTSMTANAADGTYYIRVRAVNACNTQGAASSEVVARVGVSQPPPELDWLTQVNDWRARTGLGPVTENPTFSAGDVLHARYSVKHDILMHDEDPASPWFTAEGRAAALASNGAGSFSVTAPDSFAIESWIQGPFHAVGMLDPRLMTSGYGAYREADGGLHMSGWLDVIRGRGAHPGTALPIAFPANGMTIPIPTLDVCRSQIRQAGMQPEVAACFWGESPSPLTSCPGYTAPAGLPLILQFAPATNPVVTASSLMAGGVPLEHCVFTGATYVNPDAASQQSGRGILTSRGAVVLVPKVPLPGGTTYTASVTANGQAHAWSFTIAPADAREGPLPDWALKAVPPSFVRPQ